MANSHLQSFVPFSSVQLALGRSIEEVLNAIVIVTQVLRLKNVAYLSMSTAMRYETRTSSSACAPFSDALRSNPRRIFLAALLCSSKRTAASPLPSFAPAASSNTRPWIALLLSAGFKLASVLRLESNFVWMSLCSKASFSTFDLRLVSLAVENR